MHFESLINKGYSVTISKINKQIIATMWYSIKHEDIGYVWFLEITKQRKKVITKIIFSCLVYQQKYKRKSNIIKIS